MSRYLGAVDWNTADISATVAGLADGEIALLGVKYDDVVVITISGPDAQQAANALLALHKDNFGDRDEDVAVLGVETQSCTTVDAGVVVGTPASAGYAAGPAQALNGISIEQKNAATGPIRLPKAAEEF